jgi:hypothetical protein
MLRNEPFMIFSDQPEWPFDSPTPDPMEDIHLEVDEDPDSFTQDLSQGWEHYIQKLNNL